MQSLFPIICKFKFWLSTVQDIIYVFTDFAVTKVNNITVIKSSQKALVRGGPTGFEFFVVTSNITKLFAPYTNFIITANSVGTSGHASQEIYRREVKCNFQSGGGINYFTGV